MLVTGGRGFLGTHVCAALREAGHETAPPGRTDGELGETGRIEELLDQLTNPPAGPAREAA